MPLRRKHHHYHLQKTRLEIFQHAQVKFSKIIISSTLLLYSLQQQSISYHPEHVIWRLSVLCYSLKRCSTEEIQKLGWKYNIFSEWNVEIENYFLLNNHEVLITAPYKKCKCGFFRRTWSVSYRMWLKKKKKNSKVW